MLRLAEADCDGAEGYAIPAVSAAGLGGGGAQAPVHYRAVSRYGASRRISAPAVIVTILFHAVLLGALLHIRQERVERKEHHLTMVNLQPPPAPAPSPPETKPQPPAKAAIVAPVPRLQVPRPAPLIATAPEPAPVAVSVPAVSPPAPSVPAAAPSIMKARDLGTRMVAGAPPRYPLESRRQREEGTVVLALTLNVGGGVASIAIARSSGFSRLDEAALRAVRKWRWAPTLRDGQAVMVQGLVEIPFVLQE